jgi:class 3 adenylate cyclase
MERKLSTIFASDVVGFSKMMGNDEEKTLQILGERREVIDCVIAEYQGIIFGSAGDSVISLKLLKSVKQNTFNHVLLQLSPQLCIPV